MRGRGEKVKAEDGMGQQRKQQLKYEDIKADKQAPFARKALDDIIKRKGSVSREEVLDILEKFHKES